MIEFIDSYRIANDISMNTPYQGAYLIVEGSRDKLLYSKFTSDETCEVIPVNGKHNVIEIVKLVNQRGRQNTLGIIDSDFQHIFGEEINMDNLIESEYHDIEIAMFLAPCFDTLVTYHSQAKKLAAVAKEIQGTLRDYILNLLKPISYLKLANKQYNLGLFFKPNSPEGDPPDYSKCFETASMTFLGVEKLITILFNYSRVKSPQIASVEEIRAAYNNLVNNDYDLLQLSNGHDIIHILQICLRKRFSNYDRKQYSLKDLEIQLILGFDSIYFSGTNIYQEIKTWETNKAKKVLTV